MLQAIKPLQQQSSVINMCDYFWQRMEKSLQGDLTDIFRGSGLADPPTDVPTAITDSWQLLPDPPRAAFPVSADGFLNIKDPLLHELVGTGFFGSPAKAVPSNSFSSMQLEVSPLIRTKASVKVGGAVQIPSPRTPTIKRRKNQARKVVCIPAPAVASSRPGGEVVPSDLWAWRKYGQKPIKGSPYPRGYYRCSSSKGCLAKKQVERSRTDPNMLVITYTSDHNHPWPTQRNALAGSTRSQPSKSNNASASKSSSLSQKLLAENIISEEFEAKETMSSSIQLVEEAQEMAQHDDFDQVFHENLNELEPDDFFADLAELDADPMSLVLPNIFI